ncbi:hypothetical protein MPSEU_000803300 [Mayamaea pseudoterrestris]|nr:hypothetical protein MPSEU_000803300 [Mayamaea pseudoterrestris]
MVELHTGPLNQLALLINGAFRAIKTNAFPVVLALAFVYLFREPVIRTIHDVRDRFITRGGGSQALKQRTPVDEQHYREEMLRIRAAQQEIANEKAKEAAAKRKEKEVQEKERRNKVAKPDDKGLGSGNTLGRGQPTLNATVFNPMQPWSGTSRGYRPARRTMPSEQRIDLTSQLLHLGETVFLAPSPSRQDEVIQHGHSSFKHLNDLDQIGSIERYNISHMSLRERANLRRSRQQQAISHDAQIRQTAAGLARSKRHNFQKLRTQSPSGGAFIHMGKTGGSAISLLLRNGCHSFMPHPCRQVVDETEASRRIESYYHVPDFALLQHSHHDFYLISTRDPFDRLVSAFVYQHVRNIDARGDIDIKDKREKYAVASSCFASLESFVLYLEGNHTDYYYPYSQDDVVPTSCKDFARAVFHGRVRIFSHLFFSFRRILSFMPNIRQQVIYASRQGSLWDDWTRVNQLLGQTKPVKIPVNQTKQARNTSHHSTLPVTRELSSKAVQILCGALQEEYDAYFLWLQLARNLNEQEYGAESVKVRRRCPMVVVKAYDAKKWRAIV